MRVPFLDLAADFAEIDSDARARIEEVLASQRFVLGPQTSELERTIARETGAEHALACSSGSDALYLAMLACDLGPGTAVLVPSFTFFATAGAVDRAGARPVFVDMDSDSFNSGPEQFAAAIEREFEREGAEMCHRGDGSRLKALIAVHLFGRVSDMDGISTLADSHGLRIVEDAAQAIGCEGAQGSVGARGDLACLSFYPTKNLGGAGDGGMVTTDDAALAERLGRLRVHGAAGRAYEHLEVGINARMGELQAAVLNAKLTRLGSWTEARCRIAERYRTRLGPLEETGRIVLPASAAVGAHVYHQFTVRVTAGRERVREALGEAGVDTCVFYPLPLHLQPCFADLGYRTGDLPEAERAAAEVLSLPVHPSLTDEQVDYACDCLERAVED